MAAFSRLLIRLRAASGGDLDLILILAVIGERHFARRVDPTTPTREGLGFTETTPTPSINVLSLAEYTGLPRETMRRKVAKLRDRGWVVIDGKGNLSPTGEAAMALSDGTEATMEFIESL